MTAHRVRVIAYASLLISLAANTHLAAQGAPATASIARQRLDSPIVVASKPFGESYLLAELFSQVLEARGRAVVRRPGLGATEIAFGALRTGAIDVYPEYTGTGLIAILRDSLTPELRRNRNALFAHLARESTTRFGVAWLPPLGFANGYAIAVRRETATRLSLRTISDLANRGRALRAGFTADFIGRPDGLVGLRRIYGLALSSVRPLAPAVKYSALASGAVDVIDGYATDGLLEKFDLITLTDDLNFFPPYDAAPLVSRRMAERDSDAVAVLSSLAGRVDERMMRTANRRVEVDGADVTSVARGMLMELGVLAPLAAGARVDARDSTARASGNVMHYLWAQRATIRDQAIRHIALVAAALLAAIVVAIPLGVLLERSRRMAEWVVGGLGVLQTIPSIALLAFMIPWLGVGVWPALVALWVYALYPIARNTYSGVRDADPDAVAACEAMGATPAQRLLRVRLPLAAPAIMAGVRTAAVITVGAATLAAFIGAGGLGDPIVTGLALADSRMVLSGAVPAAGLAIVVDAVLGWIERKIAPAHLQRGTPRGRRVLPSRATTSASSAH